MDNQAVRTGGSHARVRETVELILLDREEGMSARGMAARWTPPGGEPSRRRIGARHAAGPREPAMQSPQPPPRAAQERAPGRPDARPDRGSAAQGGVG